MGLFAYAANRRGYLLLHPFLSDARSMGFSKSRSDSLRLGFKAFSEVCYGCASASYLYLLLAFDCKQRITLNRFSLGLVARYRQCLASTFSSKSCIRFGCDVSLA